MRQGSVRYSEEVCDEIIHRLSHGETLRAICRDDHMPTFTTVYDWMEEHPEFNLRYLRARELGCDALAQQCLEIADTPIIDRNGNDNVARSKVQIDTRTKVIGLWSARYAANQSNTTNINVNTGLQVLSAEDQQLENAKEIAFAMYTAMQMLEQRKEEDDERKAINATAND
jgi:hypothetical protein